MFLLYRFLVYKLKKRLKKVIFDPPEIRLTDAFQKIIIPIINILKLNTFEYKRVYCRKIYHYSISIINIIVANSTNFDMHKRLYEMFTQKEENIILLQSMKNALEEMLDEEPI